MKPEVANGKIESFAKRFGRERLYLAYHAAFPLALTPDLLYRLWANFQRDIYGSALGIPWVAVADLLLSSLCEEVGFELYEMDVAVRDRLLAGLREDRRFGEGRIQELSDFAIAYVGRQLRSDDPDVRDFAEAQRWTALAYVRPDEAARELREALNRAYLQDKMELVRLASVVETFAESLAGFEPLLVYARKMVDANTGDVERKQTPRSVSQKFADSSIYVERQPIEQTCYREILQPGALIRIKAPRQMGKTSLLNRILAHANSQGYQTVYLSFLEADNTVFQDLDKFFKWFCIGITRELQLPNKLADYWTEHSSPSVCTTRYLERYILPCIDSNLLLGLDEIDIVFQSLGVTDSFVRFVRNLYTLSRISRIRKIRKITKLRLVLTQSMEFFRPISFEASPISGVGSTIELPEFNSEQVQYLVQLYGLNWTVDRVAQLMAMVGGHPYLVRQALENIVRQGITLEQILETAPTEIGIYSDHLRQHLLTLQQYPELAGAFRDVVIANVPVKLQPAVAYKLYGLGLVRWERNQAIPRCNLYRQYFRDWLEDYNYQDLLDNSQ